MKRKFILEWIKIWILPMFLICCSPQDKTSNLLNKRPEITSVLSQVNETDSKFILTKDGELCYSKYDSGFYNLYSDKMDGVSAPIRTAAQQNIFSPFQYNNFICGLSDVNGDEKFKPLIIGTEKVKLDYEPLRIIASSKNGKFLIFQLKDDPRIWLNESESNKKTIIATVNQGFYGHSFSEDENSLIITFDRTMILINCITLKQKTLLQDSKSEILNPYISDNFVYFASNHRSEFFEIYRIALNSNVPNYELILAKENDLRLPKYSGGFLYYVEIVNNEYLLRRTRINEKTVESLTENGVIYDFLIADHKRVIAAYSDFTTPKSIVEINIKSKKIINLTGKSIDLHLSRELKSIPGLSPAHIFYPPKDRKLIGVVLFIHPGLHADFSPRWDTTLMELCHQGYVIVSPNYPMSSGYGKSKTDRGIFQAVNDLMNWNNTIGDIFKKLPLYYVAYSSGNILMDYLINSKPDKLQGAVSIMGIEGKEPTSPSTSILYILGKNDPLVSCSERYKQLLARNVKKANIHIFEDEGHWLRNNKNIEEEINKIIDFFENNS